MQRVISKKEFRVVQDIANQAKEILTQTTENTTAYETQYAKFRKRLSASNQDIPLREILAYLDKFVLDKGA